VFSLRSDSDFLCAPWASTSLRALPLVNILIALAFSKDVLEPAVEAVKGFGDCASVESLALEVEEELVVKSCCGEDVRVIDRRRSLREKDLLLLDFGVLDISSICS